MSASKDDASNDELDPDEPRTPLWMPVLGLGLFLLALGYALATSEDEGGEEGGSAGADTAAAGAAADEGGE